MQIYWELLGLNCEADPAVEREGKTRQDWTAQERHRQRMSWRGVCLASQADLGLAMVEEGGRNGLIRIGLLKNGVIKE